MSPNFHCLIPVYFQIDTMLSININASYWWTAKFFLHQLETGWNHCPHFDQNALVFFRVKMVTGQEHVLSTLDFRCHRDLHEAHQWVPPKVVERRSLALVSYFLRAAIQHPGTSSRVSLLRHSSAGVIWIEGFLEWQFTRVFGLVEWQFTRVFGLVHHCGIFWWTSRDSTSCHISCMI